MYVIELIVKAIKKLTKERPNQYNPLNDFNEDDDSSTCEHIFMPVDSTGEYLACKNCGLLVNRKALKNKNFFMKPKED